MSVSEKLIPVGGINLDVSPLYLGNDKARLIKNLDIGLVNRAEGSNVLVLKPLSNAELLEDGVELPEGQNIAFGAGVSRNTEAYIFNWNGLGNFHLYRIKNSVKQIVFKGPEIEAVLDPNNFISLTGRVVIEKVCVGAEERTYIYWTDGKDRQKFLCVEDSIATNSFDPIQFPYFAGDYDRKDLISLGVPTPLECVKIIPVKDTAKTGINLIKERTWRFRISAIDRYGRPTEHGIWSDIYYTEDCISKVINCLDIVFDAGPPLWEKILIETRRSCSTEWEIVKIIDKYGSCERNWWERPINPALNYDKETNKITFRYCGGEDCLTVPDAESQRVENPMPLTSQSLFPLNGTIALAGNDYGFKPFSCDLKDKIKFIVEKPAPDANTGQTLRNITVWINIWNSHSGVKGSQAIWRRDNRNVFGGLDSDGSDEDAILGYKQYFPDPDQGGFIAYLAGTNIAAFTEQYVYNDEGTTPSWEKYGVAKDKDDAIRNPLDGGGLINLKPRRWLQKVEFKNIRPGKYVVRLASHEAKLTDANYQRTSTFCKGQSQANSNLLVGDTFNDVREIEVDVCEADFDSFEKNIFLNISDNTRPTDGTNAIVETRVINGYVYETKDDDKGVIPIEGATVLNSGNNFNGVRTTDHNGYYFVSCRDRNYTVRILAKRKCEWEELGSVDKGSSQDLAYKDFFATDKWPDFLEEKCNRVLIRGKIVSCDTGDGIPGITVGLTRGQFISSNDNGEFEIIAHDYKEANRQDKLIFFSLGKCNVVTCNNSKCFPTVNYFQPACSDCVERVFAVPNYSLRIVSINRAGLQKGGRYPFTVSGSDWMGRNNAAQTDDRWILDIPNENESLSFAYSRIRVQIDPAARFPLWMKRLHLRFGQNLAYSEFLSWVVDRFEFIDNTGLVNVVSPTQIKIYYSSLNEFNKQNNFSTNVNWQFIDERNNLRIQDIVHFVANGDGTIFNKTITSLVKYDKDGRYFLVDYTSDLANLKEGAYIKLMRPAECEGADIYFELCKTVKIKDGIPAETDFYINPIDSYQHSRQIPTPVVFTRTVRKVVSNSDPVIYEDVEESETVNVIKPYAWSFEHDSPSDFWGTKCTNRGRPLGKNPFEGVICKRTEIALSGAIGVNGIANYHHYFDDARKTVFPESNGGIVSVVPQQNILLVICENDHFVVSFNDNAIRYDNTGKAFLVSADNQFGKPKPKSGQNYGCLNIDRNSISFYNGVTAWLDSVRATVVRHDFNKAEDVTGGKAYKYYSFKTRDIARFNRTPGLKRYWHGIINPVDSKYYLTDFNLRNRSYVNDDTYVTPDKSDTLAFDMFTEGYPISRVCSFTPELYVPLEGDDMESQLFLMKDGLPYTLYRAENTSFNKFFGVQCQHAYRFAVKTEQMKVNEYLALEVYVDEVLMYGKKVITESGQESVIPRNWFNRQYNFWLAPFLCDLNTISDVNIPETADKKLTSGDKLDGRWIDILLIGDPDNLGKYFELTGVTISVVPKEKTGVQ